jgi:general secretion pathway protein G
MKFSHFTSNRAGFTLIELLVVIAILGILAAVLIPMITEKATAAKESVLKTNMQSFANLVAMDAVNFPKDKWYGYWENDDFETLNNYIEQTYQVIENKKIYKNNVGFLNPYNDSPVILDYFSTLGSGQGRNPALFLTGADRYAYSVVLLKDTSNLHGTIVAISTWTRKRQMAIIN